MSIKFDESSKTYSVSFSKRHPTTRVPIQLKRRGISSKAEAKRVYEDLVVQVSDRIKRRIVPTWSVHLDQYFNSLKTTDLMNSTIYNREKVLRHHTFPAWENKLVDEITTEEIHRLLNVQLATNAEAHRKFFIKCIKSVFQYALEKGLINRNPTPLLKFKINDKIKSVLNEDQIVILLRRAQELDWAWYPHYAVALFSGMRNGELYALTWDKVNLEHRQILVNCYWSSKDGYKSTKSGDDRVVEIPKPLLPVLQELKLKSAGSEFVLPRLSKWDKGEQARELRFFLKTLGLPEIRFHDLRASWATMLLGKGVPPSQVMAMGGWKDMDTMMIYMRKAGINIKNSTSVLDGLQTHGIQEAEIIELKTLDK
ncbi:MAG: tyrosine-type recombinase/integrase [Bdellovibrionales bacterium]